MAEQLSGCEAAKVIDEPVKTIVGCVAALVPEGPARTLLYVVAGLCVPIAIVMYRYYIGVLAQGAKPEGSLERQDYDKLRASLKEGNRAAQLYAKWLAAFLDGIERFFGDTGMADRSLFSHAFGLKTSAPLWTPRAFDRCLFLALIYPIATIFVIWTISGHAGAAEASLGLQPNVPGWSRGLIAANAALQGFVTGSLFRGEGRKSVIWSYPAFAIGTGAAASAGAIIALCAVAGAATLTIASGSSGTGAVAFGVAVAASVASVGRVAGAVAVAVAVPVAFGLAFGLAGAPHNTVALVVAVAGASSIGILLICAIAIKHEAQAFFCFSLFPPLSWPAWPWWDFYCLCGRGRTPAHCYCFRDYSR